MGCGSVRLADQPGGGIGRGGAGRVSALIDVVDVGGFASRKVGRERLENG